MRPEDEWLLTFIEAMVAHGKPCDVRISSLRAAFAAVIPMIEAREREACAIEADTCDSPWASATHEQDDACARMAERIAAAIRARGTP